MISARPVTIAVIADTHVSRMDELPPSVLEILPRVDMVFHLGDFTSPQLLDDFEKLGNFYGIQGNHDRLPEMRRRLKRIEILEVDGKRMGLIHGLFSPVGRQRRMLARFKKQKIDILLFGHSHLISSKMVEGIFLFNPGTVTCRFPASQGSFGLLTLNGSVNSKVIPIEYDFPISWKLLTLLPALIIREGTRFLESWPYIDFNPLQGQARLLLNFIWVKYLQPAYKWLKQYPHSSQQMPP